MIDAPAFDDPRRQRCLTLALIAAIGTSLVVSPGADGLLGALLAALMIAIATIDARRYIIPDALTAAAVGLALLRAAIAGPDAGLAGVFWTGAGATIAAIPPLLLMLAYRRWRGRDGLGLGDIKLIAVAGAWLGWITIFAVIEVAALAALGAYVLNSSLRSRPLKASAILPFGLFLAPTIWIGWVVEALAGN